MALYGHSNSGAEYGRRGVAGSVLVQVAALPRTISMYVWVPAFAAFATAPIAVTCRFSNR